MDNALTIDVLLKAMEQIDKIPKPMLDGREFNPSDYSFMVMDKENFRRGMGIWENMNRPDTEPTFMGIPIKVNPFVPTDTIVFVSLRDRTENFFLGHNSPPIMPLTKRGVNRGE